MFNAILLWYKAIVSLAHLLLAIVYDMNPLFWIRVELNYCTEKQDACEPTFVECHYNDSIILLLFILSWIRIDLN
jgi:hypothetical protein